MRPSQRPAMTTPVHNSREVAATPCVASSEVFPKIGTLVTIADFGGWTKTQATHFADGGIFDKIYSPQS